MKNKTIIFADLDGTLLDDEYDCQTNLPIVNQLSALGGSVIFCSSKTKDEIEFYRKKVGISEPFISENGAAIFIPKRYFPFIYNCVEGPDYNIIKLGTSYGILREKLANIKQKTKAEITGFGDMTYQEIAQDCGLPLDLAKLAKKREYDEPFKIHRGNKDRIMNAIKDEGLRCIEGGRYFHLTGNTDKGNAVAILKDLYLRMYEKIITYGIGDGPNDLPMLKVVDTPFFIKKIKDSISSFYAWKGILQLARTNLI